MKTILIADDNALTLKSLSGSDIWNRCGYELAGAAKNGLEALEMIQKLKPDVCLLDIRMPGLTGLEVIERLREENTDSIFLILTAYDDFQFARQGLQLGVMDYLLKPVDEQELEKVLKKASEAVNEKQEAHQAQTEENEYGRSRRLLHDSLIGSRHAADQMALLPKVKEALAFEGLNLRNPDPFATKDNSLDDFLSHMIKYFEELETLYDVPIISAWTRTEMFLLLCFKDRKTDIDYNLISMKIAEAIYNRLTELGYLCAIGISNCKKSIQQIPEMNREVDLALNSRYFLKNKAIIHYASTQSSSIRNEYQMARRMQEIQQSFRSDHEAVMNKTDEMMDLLISSRAEIEIVINIAMQIALSAYYIAIEKHPDILQDLDIPDIVEDIRKQQSIQDLKKCLHEFLGKCLYAEQEKKNVSRAGRLAMDYIMEHYKEHISLTDTANFAEVSESHLCRVLKNDFGETFVNILNQVRIKAAIRLLEDGHYRVYEIADKVGFSNYAYFYQLFKKITGCPPTDYHKTED